MAEYTPLNLSDGQTFTAAHVSHIETGVGAAQDRAEGVDKAARVGTDLVSEHLDTIQAPGLYWQDTSTEATADLGYPVAAAGSIQVFQWNTHSGRIQIYRPWTADEAYVRRYYNSTWSAWSRFATDSELKAYTDDKARSPQAVGAHENALRVSELRRRVGAVRVTAKTTVTLVMDHGLNTFDAKVRPLLEARNLPVTLALNSQKWDDGQNNLVTAAMVKSWVDAGLVEPANHGRTHQAYTTDADNTFEIEGGRTELETQIGVPVDSWVQSGPFAADGFDAGNDPEKYWTTHAGREILRTHSVVTGTIPGDPLYPIDGSPVVGMKGGWIDEGTAAVESAISSAITAGKGYIVRFHPQFLDTTKADGTAYLTTTQLTSFLDKLVSWRDAGDIEVLHLRKFAVAEKVLAAPVDTGVVSLALPADTVWTSVGSITVQRYGKTVTLSVRDAKQSGLTGNQTLVTLPVGYRPAVNLYQDSYQGTRTFITSAGDVTFVSPLDQEFLSVTFVTQDGAPA